jgi:transposase
MGKSSPPYPPEFRREAIQLAQTSGRSRRAIARDLGISTETLRQWLKQADSDAGVLHDGLTTDETDEVRRLRREVGLLREEREILVKAAAFFARETDARRWRCSSSWSESRPTIQLSGCVMCWGSPPAGTPPGAAVPVRRARRRRPG